MPPSRRTRTLLSVLATAVSGLLVLWAALLWFTRITPPVVPIQTPSIQQVGDLKRVAGTRTYVRRRGNIWEVGLEGPPADRGVAMSTMLRTRILAGEDALYADFAKAVPSAFIRKILMLSGRVLFRNVERGIPGPYREEIAGIARGVVPDPHTGVLPSYHRFVFQYSIYDMVLFFEKSPLVGCTTFTVPPAAGQGSPETTAGHGFLARNFDFETNEIFDQDKAVYLVREPGRIPFASVGWPAYIGVVSGANRDGVAMVVHGGRAGSPRVSGIPVAFSLREVLSQSHTTEEAIARFTAQEVMVPHIVIVTDPSGDTAVVERVPGAPAFVRRTRQPLATTNHFEGPFALDKRNIEVKETTSTLARRGRADELLTGLPARPSVRDMVSLLRDRRGAGGTPLALGDRKAIDALIATHGVVFDTTARQLWVSEAPHLLGRFVVFDLTRLLADDFDPERDPVEIQTLPEDPLLTSGAYERHRPPQ
jgi:hypothetical protein